MRQMPLILQIAGQCIEARVDGFRLDFVGWIPVEPLKAFVFGYPDVDVAQQTTQVYRRGLFAGFPFEFFRLNFVRQRETEVCIELDVRFRDTRLFDQFSKSALDFRLARVNVPFRQVPSRRVPHKEKRLDRIATNDQDTVGIEFSHHLFRELV